jgi:hypothetical protein
MPLSPSAARVLRALAVASWAASTTLIMQLWIGRSTIYAPELAPKVEATHQAIVDNRVPGGGTWSDVGLNTTNIRIGTVFLAEGIHRATGMTVPKIYQLVDTIMLFASLVLLVVFLSRIVPSSYALLGAMAFAVIVPLTYQRFYFHPWDRLSLFFWIVLLMLLQQRRTLLFAALLPLAMIIKFDVILLPGLYFLATVPPLHDRRGVVRSGLITAGLFVITFGIYWGLQAIRPGGFERVPLGALAAENVQTIRELGLAYPPLLGFSSALLLAAVGFRSAGRFAKASTLFGLSLLAIYVVRARFDEFRTEVPVFLLLLPAALVGVRLLCESPVLSRGIAALDLDGRDENQRQEIA